MAAQNRNKKNKKTPAKKKDYNKLFNSVLIDISENGNSARSALKGKMSNQKFYELLEEEANAKRYARACEIRAEVMANEMLEIADNFEHDVKKADGIEVVDHAVINRDRLRVDSRKWLLAKLHPKKYGDKIDVGVDQKQTIEYVNISKQFPDKN